MSITQEVLSENGTGKHIPNLEIPTPEQPILVTPEIKKENVFIGLPNRGEVCSRSFSSLMTASKNIHKITIKPCISSLLNNSFNRLLCDALNSRESDNITHFCLYHSDIIAEDFWLDKLIEEKAKASADIISVVIPLKGREGVTSCGIYDNGKIRRFTMTEIHQKLPKTFDKQLAGLTNQVLLANTGILLIDITKQWAEEICFTCQDQVVKTLAGKFEARVFSEDWNFSHWAASRDLKLFNTSAIRAIHVGDYDYRNDEIWGKETEEF